MTDLSATNDWTDLGGSTTTGANTASRIGLLTRKNRHERGQVSAAPQEFMGWAAFRRATIPGGKLSPAKVSAGTLFA